MLGGASTSAESPAPAQQMPAQPPPAGQQPAAGGPLGKDIPREQILAELAKPATEPPNLQAGREMFETLCSNCHIFGGIGKSVGPDLTSVASRFRAHDIADSVLFPSKIISDQYDAQVIVTTNGDIFSGIVQRENAQAVFLVTPDSPDRPVPVPLNIIQERRTSTTSLMPEALFDAYTIPQMRNLIGFLLSPPPQQ
jgi:putative heme-binding domain-containing protein